MSAPRSEAVLDLRGIRKYYGRHVAVEDVDLTLARGEFLTFLGPSGAGKTTMLMMVAGLQKPDSGTIVLDGRSVARLPPYQRDIGMVFQHYALFPHMSVAKNVAFPLEMRGVGRQEAAGRVQRALAMVGLPGLGTRMPRELSGGQQQRVALARAMICRPALLLMDEPLGALDKVLREQLQIEIKRLHREQRMSVLYVTHDQSEALTMSDRIAVFNAGRIEQVGTPSELYERPRTRFVAGFVGETNFCEGQVAGRDGDTLLVSVGGTVMPVSTDLPVVFGEMVTVAVRPERVQIAIGGPGVPATLVDLIYLGNARRLVTQLRSGQEWSVLMQADAAEASGLFRGAAISLTWQPRYASAFPIAPTSAGTGARQT